MISSPDTWPEIYHREPYRSYALILDEQPDPPRRVSYRDVLRAMFRSRMFLGIEGFGVVSIIVYSFLLFTAHYDAIHTLLYSLPSIGPGIVCVFFPFFLSRSMTRILRYGVRTEAHLVCTRWRGRDFKAVVRFSLGGEVVEREAPAGLHQEWLKDVLPKDVIEVLVDPGSGVPRLLLRVKHRDMPAVDHDSWHNSVARAKQSGEPEETSPGRRGCRGRCVNYAFMFGLLIAVLFFTLAIISFIFAITLPTATEEGRQTVESLGLWLLLAGFGVVLLMVVLYIILATVARRKP